MSEHAWILENLESYHAGGLEPAERERLEQHTYECPACAQALQEVRGVDHALDALFADVRPQAGLEDRMIQFLRNKPGRNGFTLTWMAAAAAAVVLFGVVGAGASHFLASGELPFPGLIARRDLRADGIEKASGHYMEHAPQASSQAPVFSGEALNQQPAQDWFQASSMEDKSRVSTQTASPASPETGAIVSDKPSSPGTPRMRGMGGYGGMGAGMAPQMTQRAKEEDRKSSAGEQAKAPVESYHPAEKAAGAGKPAADYYKQVYGYRDSSPARAVTEFTDGTSQTIMFGLHFRPGDAATGLKDGEVAQKAEGNKGTSTVEGRDDKEGKSGSNKALKELGGIVVRPHGEVAFGAPENQNAPVKNQANTTPHKIVIRSGDVEFEIESFDSAVAAVTKLVTQIKGGYVDTINSEKLANGKVRGTVVVRVPPEALDGLVLDLRKELGRGGELKSLKIGSQDITKQYTDMESRLKAARTMEERLLKIIKDGKGEIKDLLNAEKELGVWRTKIEELEGELRYYANLVALSTLNITLYEKEIRAPYAIVETEHVQMGIEVEDVDKAQQQVLAAVSDAKGRITKSELKQHSTGQYNALIHFEVAPEAAGPLRDRLRQLGTVARLDIDRAQQTEGGSGNPQAAKSKRNDTQFILTLYNVATVTPRETVQISVACVDTEAAYRAILSRVRNITGRVVTSNLNRQKDEQSTATITCEVKTSEADALLDELKKAGDVMHLQFNENPDVQNVTRSRRGFVITLWALGQVKPQETQDIQIASRDVPGGYRMLLDAIRKARGRVVNAKLNEQDKQNISGELDFDIRRTDEAALQEVLAKIGDLYSRNATRAEESENVLDTKLKLKVVLRNAASIPPRRLITLGIEVNDVDQTAAALAGFVNKVQGRTVESNVSHERDGRVKARLIFDVPLATADGVKHDFTGAGKVRVLNESINQTVPESTLAVARLDVTLANSDLIIPSDEGLWTRVRTGLSNSLLAIFWSLSWVIFGVLVVLPWALVIYAVYRIVRRFRGPAESATPAA